MGNMICAMDGQMPGPWQRRNSTSRRRTQSAGRVMRTHEFLGTTAGAVPVQIKRHAAQPSPARPFETAI
jgi:hypothetical protein